MCVVLEERFYQDSTGRYWSPNGLDTQFFLRYLEKFSSVLIVSRVREVTDVSDRKMSYVEHPQIRFLNIPHYHGLIDYGKKFFKVRKAIKSAMQQHDLFILRMPGQLGNMMVSKLVQENRVFAVEVVGDPLDVFASGGAGGYLSALLRRIFSEKMKLACRHASCVSYVTEYTLQKTYPGAADAYSTFFSSINLPKSDIRISEKVFSENAEIKLVTVGHLSQLTKGVDILIDVVALLKVANVSVSLTVVGDGQYRDYLENMALQADCADSITFVGAKSKREVFEILDANDVFVLASRGEGLPRVLIEAMARGLPIVSTNVSGIPELVSQEYLAEVGDSTGFADIVRKLSHDSSLMKSISNENLRMAEKFESEALKIRRIEFYSELLGRQNRLINA